MLVKSDIISILNEALSQTAKLRKGGNQATFFCPFCHHYKRKLEVCLEEGDDFSKWHCWTCNEGGYLGSLLTKLNASQLLRQRLYNLTGNIKIIRRTLSSKTNVVSLPEEFLPLSKSRDQDPEYKNAMCYLKRRGVLYEDILRYNLGFCKEGDYKCRIIWPSYDANGNLNFFVGRYYYKTEGVLPYMKPDVDMNIVGFESFLNYNDPITLCEGVFDAAAIRNNAVPLFGKYPSKLLRERMIINNVKQVNLILDADAMKDAIKNYQLLIKDVPNIEVKIVKLEGKDPSIIGFKKITPIIRSAKEFDFIDLLNYKLEL